MIKETDRKLITSMKKKIVKASITNTNPVEIGIKDLKRLLEIIRLLDYENTLEKECYD